MKLVTYVETVDQLKQIKKSETEAILAHQEFSAAGTLDDKTTYQIIEEAQRHSVPLIWEWDILMTENQLLQKQIACSQWPLQCFKAIRVRDLGAVYWIKTHFPQVKIQLICEAANHNLLALKSWEHFFGNQLDRLIVAIELPFPTIQHFLATLKTPVEILLLGPILLFHTPRALLSPLIPYEEGQKRLTFLAESEESVHKGFRVLENQHGTQLFYPKDFSILDFIGHIQRYDKLWGRVDLRQSGFSFFMIIISLMKGFDPDKLQEIKESYPHPLMHSFFKVNKTDALFKRLKNSYLDRNTPGLIGEVVEVHKGTWMGILLTEPDKKISCGETIKFLSPYGKQYYLEIDQMVNSRLEKISFATSGELFYVKSLRGISTKTLVIQA